MRANTLTGQAVAVFFRQEHGDTQSPPARDDADLVNRIMIRHEPPNDGVPGFVISGIAFLFFRHDHGLALRAHHDLILGFVELFHFHQALVGPSGEQCGFVHQIRKIGPHHAGRHTG